MNTPFNKHCKIGKEPGINNAGAMFMGLINNRRFWLVVAAVSFVLLFLHRAADFTGIRYTTSDDISFSIMSFDGINANSAIELGIRSAAKHGRFTEVFGITSIALSHSVGTQLAYDIINLSAFFLAIVSIAAILWRIYGASFTLLFSVAFFALFPQLWHHTLPSAYPVSFWLPIIFFALFFLFLERYSVTLKKSHLVIFSLFYFLSIVQYELFLVVFLLLAIALILFFSRSQSNPGKFQFVTAAPVLAFTCVYLVLYFAYQYFAPGRYDGVTVISLDYSKVLATIYQFSIGAFSPYYFLKGYYEIFYFDLEQGSRISLIPPFSMLDILNGASPLDLFAALFSALIALVCMHNLKRAMSPRAVATALATGIFIGIASLLLYSITSKYQSWAAGIHVAYLGSRYAYIGWIIALISLALIPLTITRQGRIPLFFMYASYTAMGALIFFGSLTSSFFNDQVARSMRINTSKWNAVASAMQCRTFADTMKGKTILAPILWNRVWYAEVGGPDYWERYTGRFFGNPISFRRKLEYSTEPSAYYFTYRFDQFGRVLAIMLATDYSGGTASNFLVLTPRNTAIRLSFEDRTGSRQRHLSWGPGLIACGDYVLTTVAATSAKTDSFYFEPSQTLSFPVYRKGN